MNTISHLRELFTISDDGRQCIFHEQLERKTYDEIADILERLEGKWNRSSQAFIFQYDAAEIIEHVFASGEKPRRNPHQLHPTPRVQVLDMIESSERLKLNLTFGVDGWDPDTPAEQRNIRVLEPSIGRCGIANVVKERYPHVNITGCEIDEVNVRLAREAGYAVIEGDFLQMPVPESEEEKFDAIVMNPPFQNRGFIQHIKHAQKFLRRKGVLVSVVPSEWMKSATSATEVAFMDEVTRTSSEITTEYDKDTYESTNTTTRIVELLHPEDYLELVNNNKDYWIHVNLIEMENEYKFREEFERAKGLERKHYLVERELKRRRNIEKTPSAVEWAHEVMLGLMEESEQVAHVDNTPKEDTVEQQQGVNIKTPKAEAPKAAKAPVKAQEVAPKANVVTPTPDAATRAAPAINPILSNNFAVLF